MQYHLIHRATPFIRAQRRPLLHPIRIRPPEETEEVAPPVHFFLVAFFLVAFFLAGAFFFTGFAAVAFRRRTVGLKNIVASVLVFANHVPVCAIAGQCDSALACAYYIVAGNVVDLSTATIISMLCDCDVGGSRIVVRIENC